MSGTDDTTPAEIADDTPRSVTLRSASGEATFVPAQLRELSFEQLQIALGAPTQAEEAIGTDQFGPILSDKNVLVGVPFLAVHWEFHEGEFGEFVSMWVLAENDARYIVNDGSTGIYAQLRELTDKDGQTSMLMCKHGLRASDYDATLQNGKTIPATTHYIDTRL